MLKTLRSLLVVTAAFLLLVNLCVASPGATEQIKFTVEAVMAILNTPALDPDVKRTRLSTTIRNVFDFKSMSQRILARNWDETSPQQRERFVRLLSELLERNYISNIEGYTNEKIEFINERIKQKSAAVDTLIITKSKEIPVSYRMIQNDGEWKVYDVVIESISFVSNYRNSYGQIIKKDGIEALLAKMEEKLTQLQQESREQ